MQLSGKLALCVVGVAIFKSGRFYLDLTKMCILLNSAFLIHIGTVKSIVFKPEGDPKYIFSILSIAAEVYKH